MLPLNPRAVRLRGGSRKKAELPEPTWGRAPAFTIWHYEWKLCSDETCYGDDYAFGIES